MALKLRKHPLLEDQYDAKYELQVRLVPLEYETHHNYYAHRPDEAIYAEPKQITLTISGNYVEQANAAALIKYIERQVQTVWSQVVVGLNKKFTDQIVEDLIPTLKELLDKKENWH